jgi:hypothetical protein
VAQGLRGHSLGGGSDNVLVGEPMRGGVRRIAKGTVCMRDPAEGVSGRGDAWCLLS